MKTINIEIPKGHEIDQEKSSLSEGKIVFREIKKALPKTWEELQIIDGYWVDSGCQLHNPQSHCTPLKHNRNVFATKELAEASIAMAQLSQLREVYRDGWKPNWYDGDKHKYVIEFAKNQIIKSDLIFTHSFLSFQTPEIRDEFLNNFRDLIETAKPLMS